MYHICFHVMHLLCDIWFLRQMQELTSAVSKAEVINSLMHVIAPHVLTHRKPPLHVKFAKLSSPTS